jgi:hypothetical protein
MQPFVSHVWSQLTLGPAHIQRQGGEGLRGGGRGWRWFGGGECGESGRLRHWSSPAGAEGPRHGWPISGLVPSMFHVDKSISFRSLTSHCAECTYEQHEEWLNLPLTTTELDVCVEMTNILVT